MPVHVNFRCQYVWTSDASTCELPMPVRANFRCVCFSKGCALELLFLNPVCWLSSIEMWTVAFYWWVNWRTLDRLQSAIYRFNIKELRWTAQLYRSCIAFPKWRNQIQTVGACFDVVGLVLFQTFGNMSDLTNLLARIWNLKCGYCSSVCFVCTEFIDAVYRIHWRCLQKPLTLFTEAIDAVWTF